VAAPGLAGDDLTASVVALFIVASLMRLFMNAAGLTTH